MAVPGRDRLRWKELRRWPWGAIVLLALVGLSLCRIADTYRTFNHTFDELQHIAAGMEWLDGGTYDYETKHPPMRAVFAIGPRLLGRKHHGDASFQAEGQHILYGGGDYWRTLTTARVAALPFFVFTLALVFIWARRLAGMAGGLLALFVYSTLPLALGHAGLATTDTLLVAPFLAALFIWSLWLERPTRKRAALLGVAAAAAMLSKLSAIPFLAVVIAVTGLLWLFRHPDRSERPLARIGGRLKIASLSAAYAGLAGFALLWAAYRFSFGPIGASTVVRPVVDNFVEGAARDILHQLLAIPVPAWEFFNGIGFLALHAARGHTAFFMGNAYEHGHWAFYPVGIAVKTPIPALILMGAGMALLLRRGLRAGEPLALVPPLAAGLILLSCLASTINIGLRHLLPIFPLLAIGAGVAGAALWRAGPRRRLTRPLLAALLVWQAVAGLRAHPDYLAYFNECCASAPQHWLVDSDLDWGQDLARLSQELRRRKVDSLHIDYFGTADPRRHGLPAFAPLPPYKPVRGWVAISEMSLAGATEGEYAWLEEYEPVARAGKSIRLYRIP